MSSSEEIEGFDPKHDTARTPNGGNIKQMYEKLKDRGQNEAAEELRRESNLREQMRLAQEQPEFDPKHDGWRSSTKGRIAHVYDWLLDHGHEDEAEELRTLGTVREQMNRSVALKDEYSIPPIEG